MKKYFVLLMAVALLGIIAFYVGCSKEEAPVMAPAAVQDQVFVNVDNPCVNFVTGDDEVVIGTVCTSVNHDADPPCLAVTYVITDSSNWRLDQTHLWYGLSAPTCDPCDPSVFPLQSAADLNAATYTFCVPLSIFGLNDLVEDCQSDSIYLIAHADLEHLVDANWVSGPIGTGQGTDLPNQSPWMYNIFTTACRLNVPLLMCIPELTTGTTIALYLMPGGASGPVADWLLEFAPLPQGTECADFVWPQYSPVLMFDGHPGLVTLSPDVFLFCHASYVFRLKAEAVNGFIDSDWSASECCCTDMCSPAIDCMPNIGVNGSGDATILDDGVEVYTVPCGTSYQYSYTNAGDGCYSESAPTEGICYASFCPPTIECLNDQATDNTVTIRVTSPGGATPNNVCVRVDDENFICHPYDGSDITIEVGQDVCGHDFTIEVGFPGVNGSYTDSPRVTQVCSTAPCQYGCGYTFGYWKTHYPGDWPISVGQQGYTFAGRTYSASTMYRVLKAQPKGNAVIILAHQLFGAYLNTMKELETAHPPISPCTLAEVETAVYQVLGNNSDLASDVVMNKNNSGGYSILIALAACLDEYNNGHLNITHCTDSYPVAGRCEYGPPTCRTCSEEICSALNGQFTPGVECPLWQHVEE